MSNRHKSKGKYNDVYASNKSDDNYGTVFNSMCQSKAYQNLPIGARQFYVLCRVQSMSAHGKACLYKHSEEYGRLYHERDFVFPSSHLKRYGVDRSNACKYFRLLVEAGFIEIRECNKHIQKVNVYSFSDKWKKTN